MVWKRNAPVLQTGQEQLIKLQFLALLTGDLRIDAPSFLQRLLALDCPKRPYYQLHILREIDHQ